MAHSAHVHALWPLHFAVKHKIVSDVNPGVQTTRIPDGREVKLIVVDDISPPCGLTPDISRWWPSAKSNTVAGKLQKRILFHGHVLHVAAAVAGALVSDIYTTTSGGGSPQARLRLKYRTSPIADFGICRGSVLVPPQDRLMFFSMQQGKYTDCQDPDEHYWLYFSTLKGEELFLDFALFPFNFTQCVKTRGYPPPALDTLLDDAPCHWTERVLNKRNLNLYKEHSRLSFLRDEDFQDVLKKPRKEWVERDMFKMFGLLESFSEKKWSLAEKNLFTVMLMQNIDNLGKVLQTEQWKTYPKEAQLQWHLDPGQKIKGLNA